MKTTLQKIAFAFAAALPALMSSQADLVVGMNHSYNPPSNCNNQITAIDIDICNNNGTSATNFIVAIYLYKPTTQQHWVLDYKTVNSLGGNACVNINNWSIDMNNYCCLPAPGTDYRIGVWVDTADVVTESDENNNAGLLSGNIQVCASNVGVNENSSSVGSLNIVPNPANDFANISFNMLRDESVKISVLDITGKEILKVNESKITSGKNETEINTQSFDNGIYFIRIMSETGTVTRKIVISR